MYPLIASNEPMSPVIGTSLIAALVVFDVLNLKGVRLNRPLTSWQIVEASAAVAVFFAAFLFVAFSLHINGKPSGYYTNVGLLNHLPTAWRYALQVAALVANDVMTRYVKLRQERRAQSQEPALNDPLPPIDESAPIPHLRLAGEPAYPSDGEMP